MNCEPPEIVGAPKSEMLVLDAEQRNEFSARQPDLAGGVIECAAHAQAVQRQHERQEAVGSQREMPAVGERQKETFALAGELGQQFGTEAGRRNQRG